MGNPIDISNISVSGWTSAIRGMRNSRRSWEQSDSIVKYEDGGDYLREMLYLGQKDLALASKLAKLGGSHAKFRRMIHVSMDISAPLFWWKEFDTYKVGTVANSTSTMYSITAKEFTLDDFAVDSSVLSRITSDYWKTTLACLNTLREDYIEEESPHVKLKYWREIIEILPESYKQLRTIDLNYEVIAHICEERKGHKLVEWSVFIDKMHELPYAEELIFVKDWRQKFDETVTKIEGEQNDSNECDPS